MQKNITTLQQQRGKSKSAIFIDGDWLYHAARRLKVRVDYARLKSCLDEHFGLESPIHFFCSANSQDKKQHNFIRALVSLRYVVHPFESLRRKDRKGTVTLVGKGLDVGLAVLAMSLPDDFERIVILSGDSDFVPLVKQAKQNGREVILITIPLIARSLVEASDKQYINLESLLKNLSVNKGIPGIRGRKPIAVPPDSMYIEKGEHFTSYLVVRDLFRLAKQDIILVDPYVDDQILQMIELVPKTVQVTILSNKISPTDFCVQVQKLRKDGYTIHVFKTKEFHDRFLGVDNQWWHSGHSFKDLGGSDSVLSKFKDEVPLRKLRRRVQIEIEKGVEHCELGKSMVHNFAS